MSERIYLMRRGVGQPVRERVADIPSGFRNVGAPEAGGCPITTIFERNRTFFHCDKSIRRGGFCGFHEFLGKKWSTEMTAKPTIGVIVPAPGTQPEPLSHSVIRRLEVQSPGALEKKAHEQADRIAALEAELQRARERISGEYRRGYADGYAEAGGRGLP